MANFYFSSSTPTAGQKSFYITLNWNRRVTGLSQSDVTVEGGTIVVFEDFASLQRRGPTHIWIDVDAVLSRLRITVAEDAVDQGNDEQSIEWNFGTPVTLTAGQTLAEPGGIVTVTADFNADVTGITAADFSATDADAAAVTLQNFRADPDDASVYKIDAVMPASGSGTVTVKLAENAATEGNTEETVEIAYSPVSVVLTDDDTDDIIDYGGTVKLTATFDRAVTGIAAADFSANVGTLSGFKKVSDRIYEITWTAPASGRGTATITLAEDAASEGNPEITRSLTYPTPPATVTLSALPTSVSNGAAATVTATFSKDVTGVDADDFSADQGAVSGFTKVSAKVYRVTWTAPTSGTDTATITLRANAATERNAVARVKIGYAPAPPATVTLTRGAASVFTGRATRVTATFSKNVGGVALDDFTADVGTVSTFTKVSAKVYRVTWTAPASGSGTATITLRANAATVGNPIATVEIAYSPEPPATVTLSALPPSVNSSGKVTVTATYDKDVAGVDGTDFSADVGTVSGFTKVSDKVYRVMWTAPASGRGTATITLAEDAATVGNAEATVEIAYAPIPPAMVTFVAGVTFVGNRKTTLLTAMFSKAVTGLALDDFSADVGRLSGFTPVSATVYRVTWTAPASGRGTATITLRANAATVGNPVATVEIGHSPEPDATLTAGPEFSDTYDETLGYNVLPESLGALKRVYPNGAVVSLGNVYYTDRPYNIAQTRMLSIEDDLHLCAGYGNIDEVLRYNSPASQADNMVHIVYGKTLHYVLPQFSPTGSVYAGLATLAKDINATLSFEKNLIMIADRRPYRASTQGATGTGTRDLSFSDANKAFPKSGYLFIGKEILKYTGISGGAFTGITRGVLGAAVQDHPDKSRILYLDTLIKSEGVGQPYKTITLQADVNRIFNVIRDSAGIVEVRDEDSIARYGERPYILELGLTRHEKAWIEEVFQSYLEELSTLQQIVNIQVVPDFSLRLGQIVSFTYAGIFRAMRIISIRYERTATHIRGRTL
ncbi:hypothetical protein F4X10_06675 [Candidatus Poribacteria bacterium]|nr:hypothetical protein [Candidatus Poribacteria bacterium]MYC75438.1 hypothetical protein [Candidatus Poribacteria bacterium]